MRLAQRAARYGNMAQPKAFCDGRFVCVPFTQFCYFGSYTSFNGSCLSANNFH